MKSYEIYDEENDISIGTLLYYEKERSYIIELCEGLDEWTAPIMFTYLIKQNKYTVPSEISYLWVKERIIPSGRQNINSILNNHKLKEYSEIDFLELAEGRCAQDHLYVRKIDRVPEYVKERAKKNVKECSLLENDRLLCFFVDGCTKIISLADIAEIEDVDKILKNKMLMRSVSVGVGGYSISFNRSIDISAVLLYDEGKDIPLTLNDFALFVQNNIVDTSGACDMLECSRQNLSYMVKEGSLSPIRLNLKGNLYLKGNISEKMW
ncbi:MAG: hypothetical protein MJ105_09165 [Lachnospiraceae bacterium]|nr:hypothetical protein [Lachnospiraceae bacterium]